MYITTDILDIIKTYCLVCGKCNNICCPKVIFYHLKQYWFNCEKCFRRNIRMNNDL